MERVIFLFLLLTTTVYFQPLQKDMLGFADRRAAFMEKYTRMALQFSRVNRYI